MQQLKFSSSSFFTISCQFTKTIMNVCEQPVSQLFCDFFSVQCDLGYQEKFDLKVSSTEHEVHSITIRSIKHTTATYTTINFHSNSKNQQFNVMIFVSSSLVTVMLLLNTVHKCNKRLLVPDVINVY